jgi:hypothetical protein
MFTGFSPNELNRHFGIEQDNEVYDDESILVAYLEVTLSGLRKGKQSKRHCNRDILNACREYVLALTVSSPRMCLRIFWDGLLNIRDNKTFLQTFILLLPVAWSPS